MLRKKREDYYPFGLTFNGWQRNNYRYQGTYQDEGLNWKDLGFRNYDTELGRFYSIDPLAELQLDLSTYHFAGNDPIRNIDVLGLMGQSSFLGGIFGGDKDKRKNRTRNRDLRRMRKGKPAKSDNLVRRKKRKKTNGGKKNGQKSGNKKNGQNNNDQRAQNNNSTNQDLIVDLAMLSARNYGSGLRNISRIDSRNPEPLDDQFRLTLLKQSILDRAGQQDPILAQNERDQSSNPTLLYQFYEKTKDAKDVEELRQQLYASLPQNEARAIEQLSMVKRNVNTNIGANRLKLRLAAMEESQRVEASSNPISSKPTTAELRSGTEEFLNLFKGAKEGGQNQLDVTQFILDRFTNEESFGPDNTVRAKTYQGRVTVGDQEIDIKFSPEHILDGQNNNYVLIPENIEIIESNRRTRFIFHNSDGFFPPIVIEVDNEDRSKLEDALGIGPRPEEQLQIATQNLLNKIKDQLDAGEELFDVTLDIQEGFSDPDDPSNPLSYNGLININGKEIEIDLVVQGEISEGSINYILDLSDIDVAQDNGKTKYIFNNLDSADPPITIEVKDEDKYELEDYIGVYAVENELNSKSTMTAKEMGDIRGEIEKVLNEEKKKEFYRDLQYKPEYVNQRTLDIYAREGSLERAALKEEYEGDVKIGGWMCQLTVLGQIIELYGKELGDDIAAISLELNRQNDYPVPNPLPAGIASYKSHKNYRTKHKLWQKVLSDNGLEYSYVNDINLNKDITQNSLEEAITEALGKGHGILVGIDRKKSIKKKRGHVVRIVGINENGLIVDDPYGETDIINFYNGGTRWSKENDRISTTEDGPSVGHEITWKWNDLTQIRLKYMMIIKEKI